MRSKGHTCIKSKATDSVDCSVAFQLVQDSVHCFCERTKKDSCFGHGFLTFWEHFFNSIL